MAYVDVPGSNSIWQYDNAATISNTYKVLQQMAVMLLSLVLELLLNR